MSATARLKHFGWGRAGEGLTAEEEMFVLARALNRDHAGAPDVVAYPRDEREVAAVLDWAGGGDATVTPFGGGSSVAGGVEPKRYAHKGAVAIDLREMGKVREVDKTLDPQGLLNPGVLIDP